MSDAVGWEVPYIPPQGIVPECLLPDTCVSGSDPLMAQPLAPLGHFDHPQLKSVMTSAPCNHDPLASLRRFIAKECAGLPQEHRPNADQLRQAFRTGEFTEPQAAALDWAFGGMRRKYAFPLLVAGIRLPIFDVARCFWNVFAGHAYGCGPWLNQWAEEPDKSHPSESFLAYGARRRGSRKRLFQTRTPTHALRSRSGDRR